MVIRNIYHKKFSKRLLRYLIICPGWIFIRILYCRLLFKKRIAIEKQCKKGKDEDGWPFNPYNCLDKYPYFGFMDYLEKRGHTELIKNITKWGDEKLSSEDPEFVRRSKTTINKMKLEIREYCPELIDSLEGKEARIRLMSGTWTAFRFSFWLIVITLLILSVFIILSDINIFPPTNSQNKTILLYAFIYLFLLIAIVIAKRRIERLFHYRRVSELFHIVQAAALAKGKKENKQNSPRNSESELSFEVTSQ